MTTFIYNDGEVSTSASAFTTYGGSIPKTLSEACRRHAEKVAEVGNEGEDGFWIYLSDGWIDDESGCHAIHEYTVRECVARFRFVRRETEAEARANNSAWLRAKEGVAA